ncbi:transient receptor potential channel pyrexia [Eurytemora carolleeae]|uniref:transient receptor potential channel pyrexia n=1 Tax=Eurytemora carolleeae TaxID=1294199 RepID=UPI000C77CBB4|nr:transient receptor potential channel pyrexia [Eurytemora carolleeae]|eukprot:XP_023343221.1 transient receptor potential channel pyrexia-like [Eurytemora affinis]
MFSHPIFELFLKLKWNRVWKLFWVYITWSFLYSLTLVTFILEKFSFLNGHISGNVLYYCLMFFQVTMSLVSGVQLIMFIYTITASLLKKNFREIGLKFTLFADKLFTLISPCLLGVLLYKDLSVKSEREVSAVLIFLACFSTLSVLSKIPRIGIQKLMIVRVFYSIGSFFLSYFPLFFSFALIYHILLPNVLVFSQLDTALIKAFTMLMGEFDFTANFVASEDSSVMAKVFFFMYLVMMSLVVMNLVLGLAVSDIHELEKDSKVRSSVLEYYTLNMIEKAFLSIRKCPGLGRFVRNPSIFTANDGTHNTVYLDLVDLDKNPLNRIYVANQKAGIIEEFECPHDIIERMIEIIKKIVRLKTKKTEDNLETQSQSEIKEALMYMKKNQEALEEQIKDIKTLISKQNFISVKSALD